MYQDKNGNRVDESDTFLFTPPDFWDTEGNAEQVEAVRGLRGRVVRINKIITHGNPATASLKSPDPVMQEFLRSRAKWGCWFPLDWLTLLD